jgi:hypothetical protein
MTICVKHSEDVVKSKMLYHSTKFYFWLQLLKLRSESFSDPNWPERFASSATY